MPDSTDLLIQRLKALADGTRLRLVALCRLGECSVSELTTVVGLSQPRVSQQLKVLCDAGLLERFRDGQRVYYRLAQAGADDGLHRQLLQLVPQAEADAERLRAVRGGETAVAVHYDSAADRALHRAILRLTVTEPVGDLLDIGCGRGRLLKLLSGRALQAVGVDIDADARDFARAEVLLAGLGNCSLRKGDMYRLPFDDESFDTVILDDVLLDADSPVAAMREARRLVRASGRLLLLQELGGRDPDDVQQQLAGWCADTGLRMAPPQCVPRTEPTWMLAVARPAQTAHVAA